MSDLASSESCFSTSNELLLKKTERQHSMTEIFNNKLVRGGIIDHENEQLLRLMLKFITENMGPVKP